MSRTKITKTFSKFGSTKLIIITLVFCLGTAFAVTGPNVFVVTPEQTSTTPSLETVTKIILSSENETSQ